MLAGCGDHPVPPDGTVTKRHHSDAWTQVISCGKGCVTSIPWPESWTLTITATHNPNWKGDVEVDQDVFNRCKRGALWPQCSCDPEDNE